MTILNAQTLPKAGPNIEFAALPSRLDFDKWPAAELYREHIFFEWPDDLLGSICSLTHTDLFFHEYDFTQHYKNQKGKWELNDKSFQVMNKRCSIIEKFAKKRIIY